MLSHAIPSFWLVRILFDLPKIGQKQKSPIPFSAVEAHWLRSQVVVFWRGGDGIWPMDDTQEAPSSEPCASIPRCPPQSLKNASSARPPVA